MDRKTRIQQINSHYRLGGARSTIVSDTVLGRQPLTVTRLPAPVVLPSTRVLSPPQVTTTITSSRVATPLATTFSPISTTVVPSGTVVQKVTPVTTVTTPLLAATAPVLVSQSTGPLQPIRQTTVQTVENSPSKSDFQPSQPNPNYWEPDVVGADSRQRIDPVRRQNCCARCCERCTLFCPRCCGCPWWLCFLLTLLALGLLIGAAQFLLRGKWGKKAEAAGQIGRGGQVSTGGSSAGSNAGSSEVGGADSGAGERSSGDGSQQGGSESGSSTADSGSSDSGAASAGSDSSSGSSGSSSSGSSSSSNSQDDSTLQDSKQTLSCLSGYFLYNGKCLKCPGDSKWNGTHCIKREIVNKVFVAKVVKNSSGTFVVRNQTADGERGKVSPGFENGQGASGNGSQEAGDDNGNTAENGSNSASSGSRRSGNNSSGNSGAESNESGNQPEGASTAHIESRGQHLKSSATASS